ncbi:beta-1,3-galactosyltransferase 5-like [Mercenaria mercenaria]|uniref:beta-1,3-galactosyltransferase 5-like n=1 Tax=Mercenaria mercenaria TaxID=6596 RepID=UPI00234E6D72|nr:beta-1,3-galactosyltransferase 5-like [Mercenaria mercenaria]
MAVKMESDINSNLIPSKVLRSDFSTVGNVFLVLLDFKPDTVNRKSKFTLKTIILVAILFWLLVSLSVHAGYESESEVYYNSSSHKIKISIDKKFLIPNEYFCQIHTPYLLVIVPSRIESFKVREVIRETYASLSRDRVSEVFGQKIDVVVRTLYVIGTNDNGTTEKSVFFENMKYRDILQVDIADTYYNLTDKMLHALKWIDLYCKHVTYILKADEDVFVNIGILVEQLKRYIPSEKGSIYGHIFDTPNHLGVLRDGRWAVTHEEYPLENYPPYAQGTSYTMSKNLVRKIIHSAQNFPYLHIEDVFITGIVAGKIHKAELVKLNKTSKWGDGLPSPCGFAKNQRLAQHRMTPHLMYQTWKALMSYQITCMTYRGRTMKH